MSRRIWTTTSLLVHDISTRQPLDRSCSSFALTDDWSRSFLETRGILRTRPRCLCVSNVCRISHLQSSANLNVFFFRAHNAQAG